MPEFEWRPAIDILDPHGIVQTIRNHWWLVDREGRVCFYKHPKERGWGSPQCSTSRTIAEQFLRRTPGAVALQRYPLAFVSVDPRDY